MSLNRDMKELKQIANQLMSREMALGKEMNDILDQIEGKVKTIPFVCLECGFVMHSEQEAKAHKCNRRYVVRMDRKPKPLGPRKKIIYIITYGKRQCKFYNRKDADKCKKLLAKGLPISEAIQKTKKGGDENGN